MDLQPPSPFDEGRDLRNKAVYSGCYAPLTSMYFDQFGKVRPCCENTSTILGDVTRQPLAEIWNSAQAEALRAAVARRDLSLGCQFCQWQLDRSGPGAMFSRLFDHLPVHSPHPPWPVRMDFALSNACNLQCSMCNGDWSSSIRARREGRAPLPVVYREEFFDQLTEFLPRLREATFLGGEPLLGAEPLRVLRMIADGPADPAVTITTNGTQWSSRVERILRELRVSICVSIDGITKSTFEAIRRGADFESVMANVERFRALALQQGGTVSIAHCLMRSNWSEFLSLLRFAEERELGVFVNTVIHPGSHSLYSLDAKSLEEVVEGLLQQDSDAEAHLSRLLPVWRSQLDGLTQHLDNMLDGTVALVAQTPWHRDLSSAERIDTDADVVEMLRSWGGGEPMVVTWDEGGVIKTFDHRLCELLETAPLVGRPADALAELISNRFGRNPSHGPLVGWENAYELEWPASDEAPGLGFRLVAGRIGERAGMLVALRRP